MFRNYLAAALRNLARNKLYAGVTIFSLSIGFAAALLIGLYVRDELTHDRFIPGWERIYFVATNLYPSGSKVINSSKTPMMLARPLALDFPEIEAVARLSPSYFPPNVRRGDFTASERNVFWADPSFFQVAPLPALAGDLAHALDAPDSIVLTEHMARKYFGRAAPLGEVLHVDGHPLRVTAVLKDLPSNTHLKAEMIGSGKSIAGPIVNYEGVNGPLSNTLYTYARFKPGASPATATPRLPQFLDTRLSLQGNFTDIRLIKRELRFVPLAQLHFEPFTQGDLKPPVDRSLLAGIALVGVLIIVVAAVNFVTLMTARAARRAVEVGVRKAAGAGRGDLIVQFLGEAFIYVASAAVLALALVELLLPTINAAMQRTLELDYLHDPGLVATVVAVVLVTGLLAGTYPAFVLSGFRPATVLKGGPVQTAGGPRVRQALVVGQFAILLVLALGAITITRQTLFAVNGAGTVDKDQVQLLLSSPCLEAMRDEVRKLPGVRSAACTSYQAANLGDTRDNVLFRGRQLDLSTVPIDFRFFDVIGVKPIAGRLIDPSRSADSAMQSVESRPPVILNESAVRKLGFRSPQAAIGQTLAWHGIWDEGFGKDRPTIPATLPSEIIGVVPDFTLGSVRNPIFPSLYSYGRNRAPNSIGMVVKTDGVQDAQTLPTIDRLWKRFGGGRPLVRVPANLVTLQQFYLDVVIQGATVVAAGLIALVVAALGLFALSAYTTERRTKEIGVRKALGASSQDILKLLLWQFAKPVLVANLIAWPLAWFAMRRWLEGFAYRVDLAPWTFVAAGAAALAIALATVFVHALNVARAKPVGALRYE